ncbi:O-antigen ligase family protein [Flavitalea sp. BT771]|uniref:O-antigen ligase family protein n=1 Tax=Flavitalea sp. BT771 TaxID=3063329 RepID=UPI0026E15DCF|nr:O-antigen ligase family protein [Flavitalea sp. BT771]MDO6430681.1 O-antigen ligase family protein [Flavitalea sp. BT771]MDV6219179.1 O-antigen ligase family protein [Flavitalea sp. BT771]
MREIFYIDDTPANKISYYFLLAFLVMLPFDRLYSELALIGLGAHTLFHVQRPIRWSFRWIGWLTVVIFLLTMAGTLYAPKPSQAFPQWEKQLALVLFPLITWLSGLDWQRYRLQLMKAFAFSCVLTAVYLYGVAFHTIYALHLPLTVFYTKPYMNHHFTEPIDLHATYFSAYLALSLVVLADLALRENNRKPVQLIYSVAILVCLATILQLASRAVCIAVVIIVNILIPFLLTNGRARLRLFIATFTLTVMAVFAVSRNNHLHSRYMLQLKQDLRSDTGAVEDPEPRMARWQCAWELIRASPWIGYGTGAETDKLKERYAVHNLVISYTYSLNAHNQFLSFWLRTGLFGMLWYMGTLILGFKEAWRRRDLYLLAFLLIITCVSFAENILDVNKGIFFFSFFFVFFTPKPVCESIFTHGNKNTGSAVGTRTRRYYRLLPRD